MAEDSTGRSESDSEEAANHQNTEMEANNIDQEPDFSDPEDFVDDISDEELVGDLLKSQPQETDGVESVIIVDGIPKVGPDRVTKLKSVLSKLYSGYGEIISEHYPLDENNHTRGYAFFEFTSSESASDAAKSTQNYRLDKNHVFDVNVFTDFSKFESIADEWEEPLPQPYVDHGNLRSWLQDPDAYDQYSATFDSGAKTAIFRNSNPEPSMLQERDGWTESYVEWSPLGTYLATFHIRGIALWGGENFSQIMKFSHAGVQCINFSPCEQYLVTFSNTPDARDHSNCLIIWEIRTGAQKRSFMADSSNHSVWPVLRWSFDDKYFAKMGKDVLSIYETPSFGLLGKKSIKVNGIKNFSWSPAQNIVAYWVAEEKDVPARVMLLEIPSKLELRIKNLFSVADCMMHWQKSGGYLCVKVDRYTKSKKEKNEWKYSGLYYNFEIFHMREKNIPVDSTEIKENITAFAWEPIGNKFAVIHGENPHISVSFYQIKDGGTVTLLKKFERKQCNRLFWSPNGQFIVLAGLRTMNGPLEFIDTSDFTVMATSEHFMATDIEWDPTGRYVISGVSWWVHKVDNAYWVWTFQGKLIRKHDMEKFCQLLWRPRPQTLLIDEKIKEVKKNLKKYSSQFDIKDRMTQSKASKELVEKRKNLLDDFRALRQKRIDEFFNKRHLRLELRNSVDTDELDSETGNLEEEVVEFLLKEDIVIIEEN